MRRLQGVWVLVTGLWQISPRVFWNIPTGGRRGVRPAGLMMKVCSQLKSLNKFELSAHSFSRLEGKRSLWALNSSIVRGNTSQYSWDLLYHLAKITKIILTDVSEIERSRPESERRKCPKLDGTVRNQMVLSLIRRKRSESGGNVRNQTEASCGEICVTFFPACKSEKDSRNWTILSVPIEHLQQWRKTQQTSKSNLLSILHK